MAEWKKVVVSGSSADLSALTLDTKLAPGEGGTGQSFTLSGNGGKVLKVNTGGTAFELGTDAGGDVTTAELNASSSAIRANMVLATASIAALVADSASFSTRVTSNASGVSTNTSNISTNSSNMTIATASIAALVVDSASFASRIDADAGGDVTTAELNASSSAIRANMTLATASIAALVADSASFSTRVTSNASGISTNTSNITTNTSGISTNSSNMTLATASIAALVVDSASFASRIDNAGGDVTTAQLNASSSTLQTNIDGKANIAGDTFTGDVTVNTNFTVLDNVTLGSSETDKTIINGALVVNGTASFAHADNLAIADKYILINSGSTGTGDGGLVVQSANTPGIGELVGFDQNVSGRWGITSSFNAQTTADFVPSAFMGIIVTDTVNDPASSLKTATYEKAGNMYIDTDAGSEGIWIYN